MSWLARAIIAGITSFAATNIDDLIVLMFFLAQVNATFRIRHIVIGQYLGFTALILASLPGFFGGLIVPRSWIGLLGFVPIIIGISRILNCEKEEDEVQTVSNQVNTSRMSIFSSLLNPQTFNVAAVTIANGGDNIGIYVPLFASSDFASLGVILSVFFLLISVWCYIAYLLTRQRSIAHLLTRYGHAIVPFVLIVLGIYILIDSGIFQLLQQVKAT
jgi:cadmium resistance transport/sequestration family protein